MPVGKRILYVAGRIKSNDLYIDELRDQGHEVVTAGYDRGWGGEYEIGSPPMIAEEILEQGAHFDMVIANIALPDRFNHEARGISLLETIQEQGYNGHVVVLDVCSRLREVDEDYDRRGKFLTLPGGKSVRAFSMDDAPYDVFAAEVDKILIPHPRVKGYIGSGGEGELPQTQRSFDTRLDRSEP